MAEKRMREMVGRVVSDVNDKTIKKIEDNILKIKNNKEIDLSLLK